MAIDFEYKTWPTEIKFPLYNDELLTLRVRQLQDLSRNQTLAMLTIEDLREKNRMYKKTRSEEEMPKEKEYVLVRASDVDENKGMKLRPRWIGPYYCDKIIGNMYLLKDLNGNNICYAGSGHRVKRYFFKSTNEKQQHEDLIRINRVRLECEPLHLKTA
ncbi:hypothetical protein HMI56_005986, partial [Coelomomyces lativittatus]